MEHVGGCKHCREKHSKIVTDEVPPLEHEIALRTRLRDTLATALMTSTDPDTQRAAVTKALVQTAIDLDVHPDTLAAAVSALTPHHPSLVHALPDRFRVLRLELAACFLRSGPAALLCTLAATKEERLGRELNRCRVRDRKFPRVILSCVMSAIRDNTAALAGVTIGALVDSTDLHVAMELALLKPAATLTAADRSSAAALWAETLGRDGGARYANELVKDRGAVHRRRYDSGLKTLQMIYMLR